VPCFPSVLLLFSFYFVFLLSVFFLYHLFLGSCLYNFLWYLYWFFDFFLLFFFLFLVTLAGCWFKPLTHLSKKVSKYRQKQIKKTLKSLQNLFYCFCWISCLIDRSSDNYEINEFFFCNCNICNSLLITWIFTKRSNSRC